MSQNTVTIRGKKYTLDRHGFLDPPEQWDADFAEGMAAELGIHGGLTGLHWSFINFLRHKFLIDKTVPVVVHACAELGLRLSELRELFPAGYHRGACKLAGIDHAFMSATNLWLTYETISPPHSEHEVDPLGFLKDFDKWNERFAQWVARNWNLPAGLTEKHWSIIAYLRQYYVKTGNIPTVYQLCSRFDLQLEDFGRLFPAGYRRGACRAAGLQYFS